MINLILLTIGLLLLIYSVVFFAFDCKGKLAATMGGNMSFAIYWFFGSLLFSIGDMPICGLSRWWSIAGCLTGVLCLFPVRWAISRLCCDPYKPELTGFQKFIRRTETKQPPTRSRWV
jgi:hypothetical protein